MTARANHQHNPRGRNGRFLLFLLVIAGLIGGARWLAKQVSVNGPNPPAAPAVAKETTEMKINRADAILRKAQALIDRMVADNKPSKTLRTPILKTEIADAKFELGTIAHAVPELAQRANDLIDKIYAEEERGQHAMQAAIDKAIAEDSEGRKQFAKQYEENALLAGYSVTVTVSGPKATVFNLKYALLGKASIYQLLSSSDLQETLQSKGFLRLNISDGYHWNGHVDLARTLARPK